MKYEGGYMRHLSALEVAELAAGKESLMPSTAALPEKFSEYKELRNFEAENKGFAERLAAGLNKAVTADEAKTK
jgi:hypothetical protein